MKRRADISRDPNGSALASLAFLDATDPLPRSPCQNNRAMELITKWLQGDWFFWLAKNVVFTVAKAFWGLQIEGRDKVPRDGGLIVVSNHISLFDPPVVGVSLPREVNYMAKKELFENRYLRALILGLRTFPVDRSGNASSAIKEAIRRSKRGIAVGIFVQGTRNAGDAQALDGAAFIAQRAGAPIQPTAIWQENGKFRVKFGDIIVPEGKTREEAAALTSELTRRINALLPPTKQMQVAKRPDKAA